MLFIAALAAATWYAVRNLPSSADNRDIITSTIVVGNWTMVFGLLGALAIIGWNYGRVGNFEKEFWLTFSVDVMVAIASAAVGALLGFIFGVPRTLDPASRVAVAAAASQAGPAASSQAMLAANTNLERISDWLTTLLIGATLVQIKDIVGWIGKLGGTLDNGHLTNKAAVPVIVVYFLTISFLGVYLITRLYLTYALKQTLALLTGSAAPKIVTTTLPDGKVGTAYSATLQVSGGVPPLVPPLTWSIAPPLPSGLTLDPGTGAISGTPAAAEPKKPYRFTVTDSAAPPVSLTADISFAIAQDGKTVALTITTTTLPPGKVGTDYSATLQTTGGTPPLRWSVSPALPAGLTLDSSTGIISGKPSAVEAKTYRFTVVDSASASSDANIALQITP